MKKIIIIFSKFILDRITKSYFIGLQEAGNELPITIFPFLDFIFIYNFGNAFGLFQLEPNSYYYHAVTIFIAMINFIIFLLVFEKINGLNILRKILNFLSIPKNWRNNPRSIIFALILGGGMGNLYDRIVYRAVIDFIDLHVADFHWPAFNIADSFITAGIIGLILAELLNREKVAKNV